MRSVRHERGLSQEDFAEICGVHRNYIGRVERGECEPSLGHLLALAAGSRVRLAELMARAGL